MTWHDIAWHGMAGHGMARHGMACHSMPYHQTVLFSGLKWKPRKMSENSDVFLDIDLDNMDIISVGRRY